MNIPKTFLVTAYRRTGKDTFFKEYSLGKGVPRWRILRLPNKELFPTLPVKRVAFADKMKESFLSWYRLGDLDLESLKDTPALLIDPNKTYRELLIEYATYHRWKNPDVWIMRALPELLDRTTNTMVTDWRFPNESRELDQRDFDLVTIRLFRKDVPIPEERVEHLLDNVLTDYLLIPHGLEEYRKAMETFPQYKNYVDN